MQLDAKLHLKDCFVIIVDASYMRFSLYLLERGFINGKILHSGYLNLALSAASFIYIERKTDKIMSKLEGNSFGEMNKFGPLCDHVK